MSLLSEATVVPPPRKVLQVIIDDGDDEGAAQEKALAEHVACHPEDAGRTVKDFYWIVIAILRPIIDADGRPRWSDGRPRYTDGDNRWITTDDQKPSEAPVH
jgi:hypothetical protein